MAVATLLRGPNKLYEESHHHNIPTAHGYAQSLHAEDMQFQPMTGDLGFLRQNSTAVSKLK